MGASWSSPAIRARPGGDRGDSAGSPAPARPYSSRGAVLASWRSTAGGRLAGDLDRPGAVARAAEELGLADLERPRSGDEAEDLRRRSHVKHLVESAKLAVRAAGHTSRQIEDRVRRRQGA